MCESCAFTEAAEFATSTYRKAIEEDCYPEYGMLREAIGECARENPAYVAAFRVAWKAAA